MGKNLHGKVISGKRSFLDITGTAHVFSGSIGNESGDWPGQMLSSPTNPRRNAKTDY